MKQKTVKYLIQNDLGAIKTYQAGIMQASVQRLLQKRCDHILQPYNITKNQWFIIGTIHDAGRGGIRVTDLAAKLNTTLSYLTNTINLLESKQIVSRRAHNDDTRAKLVKLHQKFASQYATIESDLRQQLRQTIYAHIAPEDFRTYMRVMYQLSELD